MRRYLDIKQSSLSDIDTFNRYTRLNVTYNNGKFSIVSSDGSRQYSFNSIQEFDFYRECLYLISDDDNMYVITRSLEQKYYKVRAEKMNIPFKDSLVESSVYLANSADSYWILDEDLRPIVNTKYPYMRYLDTDLMAVSNGNNWYLFIPSKFEYYNHEFERCDLESAHRSSIIIRDEDKLYLWSKKSNKLFPEPFKSIESVWNDNGEFYIVSKKNKYGILDSSLKYIQYCQHDSIENLGSFYRFSNNGMFGIMNGKGIIVLDEEYTSVEIYLKHSWAYTYGTDSDSFKVCKDNKFGIWNYGFLVPCNYDSIKLLEGLDERYHLVEEAGKYGLMHYSNQYKPEKPEKKIFDAIYDDIQVYSLPSYEHKTEFLVKQNGLYGIVNSEKEIIVPIQYSSLIRVICDDHTESYRECYVDYDGEERYENQYYNEHHILYQVYDNNEMFFSEYRDKVHKYDLKHVSYFCYIASQNNKYGVIDSNNEILIPFEYDEIEINSILNSTEDSWSEEYSVRCYVRNSNGWGIRDNNKVIFSCSKASITQQEHYYIFKEFGTEKYGTISYDGTQLTEAIFDRIDHRGPYIGDHLGSLSSKGELIVPCKYDNVRTLSKSNIKLVGKNDKIGAWCYNPFTKVWEDYLPCKYEDIQIEDSRGSRLKGLKNEDEMIYANPCIVKTQGNVGLCALQKEGSVELIPAIYDYISRITSGKGMYGYKVGRDKKVGCYNSMCTEKLECIYDHLEIRDGRIITDKDGKYGLSIFNKGVIINILDCIYDEVDSWRKTFRLDDKYGRWDFVDKKPMITARAEYDEIDKYVLRQGDKYGFLGFNNGLPSMVLSCEYDSIQVINKQVEDYYQDDEGWQTGMRDSGIPIIIVVEKNSKKGLLKHIDNVWTQVLEIEYDELSKSTIRKNGQVGLIHDWNVVIPCEYDKIENIKEELGGYPRTWITHYIVSKDRKFGLYYNKKNGTYGKDDIQLAITCNCDEITNKFISRKGTFKYRIDNLWGCYSSNFNIDPVYDDIRVEDKYIITKSGNLSSFWEISSQGCSKMYCGFLHKAGSYLRYDNYLINTDSGLKTDDFDSVSYIIAKKEHSAGYYGSYKSDIQYTYSIVDNLNSYNPHFDNIVLIITNKEGKLGLYDKDLNKTLPNSYERIDLLNNHEKELIVFDGKHYGIYNDSIVLDCIYDEIIPEVRGYEAKYRVNLNGKTGLINKDYQYVIEPLYDDLNYEYINNRTRAIRVVNEGKYGLLLPSSKVLLDVEFDLISYIGTYICAVKDGKHGLYLYKENIGITQIIDLAYDTISVIDSNVIVSCDGKFGLFRLNNANENSSQGVSSAAIKIMDIAYDDISISGLDIIVVNNQKSGLYRFTQSFCDSYKLLDIVYDSLSKKQHYYIVSKDDKYGAFCNSSRLDSRALVPCLDIVYDNIELEGNKLIVSKNNKKGWYAEDGTEYLACRYDEIHFINYTQNLLNPKEVIIGLICTQFGTRYRVLGSIEHGTYSAYTNFMSSFNRNIESNLEDRTLYFDVFEVRKDKSIWCCRDGIWGKLIVGNVIYIETIEITEDSKYGLKVNYVDVLDPIYDNIVAPNKNFNDISNQPTCYEMRVGNNEGRLFITNPIILTDLYDKINSVESHAGVLEIRTGDNVGIINNYGKVVLPCQYASYEIDNNLVIYTDHSGKKGIVSLEGHHIVNTMCDRIECISRIQHLHSKNLDITYMIERNNKYGLVSDDKVTMPIIYDKIHNNSDNSYTENLIIELNGKFGLYNKRHQKISVNCVYDEIALLKTTVKVLKDELYGIVSQETGRIIVPREYQEIIDVSEYNKQRYFVRKDNKWGVFCNGELIIPTIYEGINVIQQDSYIERYFPLETDIYKAKVNGLWGLVDSLNTMLIPFEYQAIELNETNDGYGCNHIVRFYLVQSHILLGAYDSGFKKICDCQYGSIKFNEDWYDPMLLTYKDQREYRYKIDLMCKNENKG